LKRFEISVSKGGRHWCQIILDGSCSEEALIDLAELFDESRGYKLAAAEQIETGRIVEVGATVRVLSVQHQSSPVDLCPPCEARGKAYAKPD